MRTSLVTLPLLVVAVGLAACGGADKVGAGGSTSTPGDTTTPGTTTGPAASYPTGATDLVLRVTVGGGFVAPAAALTTMPSYALYGDGTVFTPGAVPAIYPGPAMQPTIAGHLSPAEIEKVLADARAAGLLQTPTPSYGDMGTIGVADAPTTTVEITTNAGSVKHAAYALSMEPGGNGMPAATAAARKTLADFIAALPSGSAQQPYTPTALSVYAGPFTGDPQPGGKPVVWPLSSDLATAGTKVSDGTDPRCIAVTGADTATLLPVLTAASAATQWTASATTNATFGLTVRIALPGETPCA